ncbi:hypothetical protein FQR65_LT20573 [Abscondita terminalis]|nr:hypothetical protein FQR65_LT20573 [Abscondita terminalis]
MLTSALYLHSTAGDVDVVGEKAYDSGCRRNTVVTVDVATSPIQRTSTVQLPYCAIINGVPYFAVDGAKLAPLWRLFHWLNNAGAIMLAVVAMVLVHRRTVTPPTRGWIGLSESTTQTELSRGSQLKARLRILFPASAYFGTSTAYGIIVGHGEAFYQQDD